MDSNKSYNNNKQELTSKPIIIFGSSRSNGETRKAIDLFIREHPADAELVDLNKLHIAPFDYDNRNTSDDFLPLARKMINHHHIILATPIYWYTMSSQMKIFVDRISDLISWHKDIGRKLRNKNLSLITSYAIHPEGKDVVENIFINTAKYLGMHYNQCFFYYSGNDRHITEQNCARLKQFCNSIQPSIYNEFKFK